MEIKATENILNKSCEKGNLSKTVKKSERRKWKKLSGKVRRKNKKEDRKHGKSKM